MSALLPSSALVPAGAVDERWLHNTLSMVGAFTLGNSNASAKRIGFNDVVEGRDVMIALRLLCLDHINTLYNKKKEAR